MRDDEYLAIKDRAFEQFLKIPHVNAVGIGGREQNGQPTGEIAIKVYVTRKKPLDEVPPEERIPASFEGVPTDVARMGPAKHVTQVPGVEFPEAFPDITDYDPRRGGGSLSTQGRGTNLGTLGCFLRDKQDGSAVYALTNFHIVMLDGKLSRSVQVAHPSTPLFEFDPGNAIGVVTEGGEHDRRDAAIVRLSEGTRWIPFVQQIGYLRGSRDVTIAQIATGTFQVRKRGVATLLTGGVIDAIGDVPIEDVRRKNVLFIRPNPIPSEPDTVVRFSAQGDSGAVVVSDAHEVVGLHFAEEQPGGDPSATAGFGFAFPIGTVLRRFRDVEKLDLEVAVAKNADAVLDSDPREQQTVLFPAGVPASLLVEQVAQGDHSHYRPLIGGAQIMAEPMLGDANSTTLGCVVTAKDNPNVAYVLTSFSSVSANGSIPPTSDTEVGQPNTRDSCSGCCTNLVGAFAKAAPATTPRAAIVKLKNDQRWLPEIMRIGLLGGARRLTQNDLTLSGGFTVFKGGAASRLTSGLVVRLPGSPTPLPPDVPEDAMLIRPHPNPLKPHDEIHFSRFVDRGAVVVDRANSVVGVLFGEARIDDANGTRVFHGLATPIGGVLDALEAAGIPIDIPVADAVNDVRTTILSVAVAPDASAAPVAQPHTERAPIPPLTFVPEMVLQSPAGPGVIAAYRRHEAEVRDLIEQNRRVAAVWRRSGGPALLQAVITALRMPPATIPASVNGVPTSTCVDRISAVFWRYGSAGLRADLTRVRSRLPSIVGLSAPQILAALEPEAHGAAVLP